MNTRPCVHFASQGSIDLNSLSILHLGNNKLTSVGAYYRLAIDSAIVHLFVRAGPSKARLLKREWRAVHRDGRNGFGKCVAASVYFHQLRADKVPLPAEDGNPQTVEISVKVKKKRFDVRSETIDRHWIFFYFVIK